jgi:ubiquinone/menaquinone biosynthesis C-methylase UbiE
MASAIQERDYVLGTHDEEIARLGLQHRVWRPRALDAWRRAGITVGQTLLDIGCGPGYASVELAEIVGAEGRVIAVDGSRRFLDFLGAQAAQRGIKNIECHEVDLDRAELPGSLVDGAWSRWVFSFVKSPRRVLEKVKAAIRPGGVLVLHEYFNYASWRSSPRLPEIEEFVSLVMKSWRADGGEPDIALDLLPWLGELGFKITSLRPIVDVLSPSDHGWQWLKTFLGVGTERLVDLGHLTADRAAMIKRSVAEMEKRPHVHMVTPAVLEIIAVKA